MVALMPCYLWRQEALLLQEFRACACTAVVVSISWSVRTARSFVSVRQTQDHKMEGEAVPLLQFSFCGDI